ncbi:amino acid ABC transporter substrate-binding protein [Candidatus Dependentiae bacterium]|nr:amino acid ABC transporter substrate-binding protein [Candidatus Dependentiae bacterium]
MSLLKKIMIPGIACAILFSAIFLCTKKTSLPQEQPKPLIIGMMNGWPPFMSVASNGEYEGYDINVAELLGEKLNRPVIIKDLGSVQTILIALDQGIIDIAMSGFDNTKKRMETFNMIQYTSRDSTATSLVFWKKTPSNIKSLYDCVNQKLEICVEPGSGQEKYVDSFPNAIKKQLPSVTDMIMELRFGKTNVLVLEPRIANRLKKLEPNLEILSEELPESFQIYGEGIMIKKENALLAGQVKKAIEELSFSNTLKKLEEKWLNQEEN